MLYTFIIPMNDDSKRQEEILKLYQKQADEIISKMYNVLVRAFRKIDDLAYRKVLEKLQKEGV